MAGNDIEFTGTLVGASNEESAGNGPEVMLSSACYGPNVWWSWTATETSTVFLESLEAISGPGYSYACMSIFSLSADFQRGFPVITNFNAPGTIFNVQSIYMPLKIVRKYCLFPATNGCKYYFQLATPWSNEPTNVFRFHLVASAGPVITEQPTSLTVSSNGSALFKLATASLPPVLFQWQFNGAEIPGASGAVLALTNVIPAQAGDYCAVVRNASGAVTSAPVHLWITVVDQRPILSALPSVNAERFAFALGGETGRVYRIESSTDLMLWNKENSFDTGFISESPIQSSVIRNNGSITSLDLPKISGHKYFRASHYVPSNEVCNMNLKMIQFAKELWVKEKYWRVGDYPGAVNLFGTNGILQVPYPQCPVGGYSYAAKPVGFLPTCSIPGHLLEEPR